MTHNYKTPEEIQERIEELEEKLAAYNALPRSRKKAALFPLQTKTKIRLLKEEKVKMEKEQEFDWSTATEEEALELYF